MKLFGLIGYPLEHSFSKIFFSAKFRDEGLADCEYRNFPINSVGEFPLLLKKEPTLCGLNVTIPYKESIIPLLDELDSEAREIGAVNCVVIESGGKTKGYNTDAYGFFTSIRPFLENRFERVLILGRGGSARAVSHILRKIGLTVLHVVRKPVGDDEIGYNQLTPELIQHFHLIVNTTPLGTFPAIDALPQIPYESLTSDHFLYDLVYNPEETLFLKKGKSFGAQTMNGYQMLVHQALRSWEVWSA